MGGAVNYYDPAPHLLQLDPHYPALRMIDTFSDQRELDFILIMLIRSFVQLWRLCSSTPTEIRYDHRNLICLFVLHLVLVASARARVCVSDATHGRKSP